MCSRTTCYFCCPAITIFVICISLAIILNDIRFKGPRCYVQQLYVPALDLSQNPISNINDTNKTIINPCLFFDLAFRNILISDGLLYGDVKITFSYGRNPVANYIVPTFFQGSKETDYRREVVESHGVPWEDAVKAVSNGSTVVFRVDLAAWPRSLDSEGYGYSKKKDVRIGADVEIDGSGMKVKKDRIRLDSAASKRGDDVGIFVLFLSLLVSSLRSLFYQV